MIELCVEQNPQRFKPRARLRASSSVVFSNAARKDQHIQAAQYSNIGANVFAEDIRKFINCEARSSVAPFDGLAQLAHVIRKLAQAHQARLLIDDLLQL